jgi:DNA-binding CsgD family transcriptional regulator
VSRLGRADLRAAVDVVGMLAADSGPEPFPLPVLARLQELIGADVAAGYVEASSNIVRDNHEVVTRAKPPWLVPALQEVGLQDPIHAINCGAVSVPVAISDFLTVEEFRRLGLYEAVCEPLGTADSLRLYLPAPAGAARFFFFDCSHRGFPIRARQMLNLLRPHFAGSRARRPANLSTPGSRRLTPREAAVMQLVADGHSNAAIAAELWISEHTVRKHLESIFAKLGVHTRTAAAARLRGCAG